jgi:hypothetical protein
MSLAPVVAVSSPSAADSLPPRKPGLWESKMSGMTGAPATTVKQCIDAKTDQLVQAAVQPGATCSKREITKTSAGYEVETNCTIGGIKAEGKGLITGDFVSSVKVAMTTTMTGVPGQSSPITSNLEMDSARVGDCAAGQSPGDIILPNGQVVKSPGVK